MSLTLEQVEATLDEIRQSQAFWQLADAERAERLQHYRYAADRPPRGWHRFIAVTEQPADGVVLETRGADLTRFHRHPVAMWDHRRDLLPIGRARAFVAGDRLMADVRFDRGDALGKELDRRARRGLPLAVSVGYDTVNYYTAAEGTIFLSRWVLTELSIVTLPADPGAVQSSGPGPLARLREVLDR